MAWLRLLVRLWLTVLTGPLLLFSCRRNWPVAAGAATMTFDPDSLWGRSLPYRYSMFAGHFGVGFGAKAAGRTVSLGTLFIAAQFVDLLWSLLLQRGIERVELAPEGTPTVPLVFVDYPISHSLF